MRFLSKILERQFAKKRGGAYNLSRAVLDGVLAAGCLMPGFAEAAVLATIPEGSITYDPTEGENTATITAVHGNAEIYWTSSNGSVEGCTINVNDVNSPNMNITPDIIISCGDVNYVNAISNTVDISNVTF